MGPQVPIRPWGRGAQGLGQPSLNNFNSFKYVRFDFTGIRLVGENSPHATLGEYAVAFARAVVLCPSLAFAVDTSSELIDKVGLHCKMSTGEIDRRPCKGFDRCGVPCLVAVGTRFGKHPCRVQSRRR